MASRRMNRARDLIKQEISLLLIYKAKDPRLGHISVTEVEMTADLKRAIVFYTLMIDSEDQGDIQIGLDKAASFFRREIGRKLRMKYIPEIVFKYDQGVEQARHMDRILKDLHPEEKEVDESESGN